MPDMGAVEAALTLSDLLSVREARRNMKWRKARLLEARDAAGVHGANYDRIGSRNPNYDSRLENETLKVITQERRYTTAQLEFLAAQLRLSVKIRSVKDARMRLILEYRYVYLMSWKQVSAAIGGGESNSADAVKTAHQRFISKLDKGQSNLETEP